MPSLCVFILLFHADDRALPQFPTAKVCEANSWEAWHWREHFRRLLEAGIGNSDTDLLLKATERESWIWWDIAQVQDDRWNDDHRFDAEKRVIEAIGLERYLAGTGPPVQPYGAKR